MEVKENCLISLATPSCPAPSPATPPLHVHAHNAALTAEVAELKAKLRHVEAENVGYLREIDDLKADLAGERRLATLLRQRGWTEAQRARRSEAERHDVCLQDLTRRRVAFLCSCCTRGMINWSDAPNLSV